MAKGDKVKVTNARGYWDEQISKARALYSDFHTSGDNVIDKFRIEKNNARNRGQDKYNILYSTTETIRPSLYAQSPRPEVKRRHTDVENDTADMAVMLLENCLAYGMEEVEFDEVMNNAVEDYSLPGLGTAWCRYVPTFRDQRNSAGDVVQNSKGEPEQELDYENVALDYVPWKDILFGPARFWAELPWLARRVYMNKEKATTRFGAEKAAKLQYTDNNTADRDRAAIVEDKQAVIWEIWDKRKREVIWFSTTYADDVLDTRPDPLRLKKFWPCPKPMRAISNTRTMVPRPFFSQYQSQAEELDLLTERIRHLTNALQVRGVYDGAAKELNHLLSPTGGNKMIAIENWASFIGQSGINGSIQWVPIKDVVEVLMRLYEARDRCKAEIYEITGFSDIVRGQSKASETLGAQQIKQDWASARLRQMQKEVQRFARDLLVIIGEIMCEHFSPETLALYGGVEIPPVDPAYVQAANAAVQQGLPVPPDPRQQAVEQFKAVVKLLQTERERCAKIDIETDSTIMPDEAAERKDRMEFLGQIGAYLQQAGPMVEQHPEMRGLLGAMMMFTVRTFRASRPIEQEFERFQQALAKAPPPANKPDEGAAKAQSAIQVATLKTNADTAKHDKELAFKAQEADKDRMMEREKLQAQVAQDNVQLQIKNAELAIKQN
jgi:hypothetical protein